MESDLHDALCMQLVCMLAPSHFKCNELEVLSVGKHRARKKLPQASLTPPTVFKHPELVKVPTSFTDTTVYPEAL